MLALGGLGRYILALDVTFIDGVMVGLMMMMVMWCDFMDKDALSVTLAHDEVTHGLWRLNDFNLEAQDLSWRTNVTL